MMGKPRRHNSTKPILRIKAAGNFGTTEVYMSTISSTTWLMDCLSWTTLMIEMSSNRSSAHRVSALGMPLSYYSWPQLTGAKATGFHK